MSIAQKILANPSAYSIEMLTKGVQDGVIPAYIGIPLIQQKTQEKSQAAGMQSAQQGKQPPIAEEVLAQAQQAGGVDNLRSNLPTQSYAPGGIVAFADGGNTDWENAPRFGGQGPQGQIVRDGYVYETPYDKMNRLNREAEAQAAAEREAQAKEQGIMPYGQQMKNLGSFLGNIPLNAIKTLVSAPGYGFNKDNPTVTSTPTTAPASPTSTRLLQPGQTYPGGISSLPAGQDAPATGIDQLIKKPAPTAGMGASADTSAGTTGAASPFSLAPAPAGKSLLDITNEQLGGDKGYLARAAARDKEVLDKLNEGKPTGKPLEDYKKSLQEEAIQAGADREQAKGMAIFKAGLAMMSGTSQFALENIGKGAMVGAEDWQAANKDLKRAQKERQKELAAIEQAERAEGRDDWKAAQAARATAAQAADARDRFGVNAIMTATGKDTELAHQDWQHLLSAQVNKYHADKSAEATIGSAKIHAGATRYAADVGADARVQAAELKAAVAGAIGEKGGLTQDQLLKWRGEYANHPEVLAWKKQLIDQYGKNVTDKPEFQQALTQKIDQVLARDATRNIGSSGASINPDDMALIKKYSATK